LSWGYKSTSNIILSESRLNKVLDNDKMIVYKASIIYFGYITLTVIINKITDDKKAILKYENKKAQEYNIKQCNSKKDIVNIVLAELLEDYYYKSN